MTQSELHHGSDPRPPSDKCCKDIHITCECKGCGDLPWWRINLLFIITWVLIFLLSILATCVWWYHIDKSDKGIPDDIASAVLACAAMGPLQGGGTGAPEPGGDRREGAGLPGPHPGDGSANAVGRQFQPIGAPPGAGTQSEEVCRAIKVIIDESIDYHLIAELAAEEVCEECEKKDDIDEAPLVLGQLAVPDPDDPNKWVGPVTLEIRELQKRSCGVENYAFNFTVPGGERLEPVKMSDLNLPEFCSGPGGIKWRILDSPRKSSTRTYVMNTDGTVYDTDPAPGIQPQLTGGPYVTFVALEETNRRIANAYILYVDAVTRQPKLVEISFESLTGRKEIVSPEANVRLLANLQLNSIGKEITFQFGSGAREIAVAGFDFAPRPTPDGSPAARRNVDASGSFEVYLNSEGKIKEVCRTDLGCDSSNPPR